MIVERSLHEDFLANTYLVANEAGGPAFFVDAGGPVEPLLGAVDRHGLQPTHVLLTHHHHDHVAELLLLRERWPELEVLAHEAEHVEGVTGRLADGDTVTIGGVEARALHTPGHTAGMLAFLVAGEEVFTGDTLFRGSVGGVKAPGSTGFEDLRRSVMDVLMDLARDVRVRPGHTDPTTIGEEWEGNRFIRLWRGLDEEGDEPCRVWGRDARLVLWGDDYDGGHKAWIRWADDGSDDIVPGSQVERG